MLFIAIKHFERQPCSYFTLYKNPTLLDMCTITRFITVPNSQDPNVCSALLNPALQIPFFRPSFSFVETKHQLTPRGTLKYHNAHAEFCENR